LSLVKNEIYDEAIMLLGPVGKNNKYLNYRKKVKKELMRLGYKTIIIMEEEDFDSNGLEHKFNDIVRKKNPSLFIAFFISKEKMDGVNFEIGWLSCKYTIPILSKKLRIFGDKKYDWKNTSAYINDLFPNVPHKHYDDLRDHSRASTLINQAVKSLS
jgi:hypothetical protein